MQRNKRTNEEKKTPVLVDKVLKVINDFYCDKCEGKYGVDWSCTSPDNHIKKAIEVTIYEIMNNIEGWHNWYLDEFCTEKSTHPIRKGKCMCWSCELGRLTDKIKGNSECTEQWNISDVDPCEKCEDDCVIKKGCRNAK